MTEPPLAELDTSRPHPARMYDYFLGGKDNFAIDREAASEVIRRAPDTRLVARQNRDFMRRAAAAMVDLGIRQFLDLGSGLPTVDNLHQVAQRAAPGSRVVYVDNDPIVLVHGRALLADSDSTSVITADLREPDLVWEQAEQTGLLDLEQPIGLMLIAVLHFVPGDLTELMHAYLDRLPSGSYVALTHVSNDDMDDAFIQQADAPYRATPSGLHIRSAGQIASLLDGTELLEPGVLPIWQWRPAPPTPPSESDLRTTDRPIFPVIYGGVGEVS